MDELAGPSLGLLLMYHCKQVLLDPKAKHPDQELRCPQKGI